MMGEESDMLHVLVISLPVMLNDWGDVGSEAKKGRSGRAERPTQAFPGSSTLLLNIKLWH